MAKEKFYDKPSTAGKYTFHESEKKTGGHDNSFYDKKTGVVGHHGSNADKNIKTSLGKDFKAAVDGKKK